MSSSKYSKDCLTKNIVFIKENIASVDRLLDILLEGDIIQMHEREDVVAKMPGERVHHMIDIVLKKRAQHIFIHALEKTGQKLIVERILKTQKDHAHIKDPKSHTMSLLTPRLSAFANFHQEQTSSSQQKENIVERKPHDEYKYLLEILKQNQVRIKQNEVKIKQLESELKKAKQTEKKYSQLEKTYRELKIENQELKAKVDELKKQLKERDEIIKTTRERTSILKDEVGSPVKNLEITMLNLIKSQQQSERKLAEATDKLDRATDKLDRATDKLDTATDKLDTATDKMDTATEKLDTGTDKLDTATARLNTVAEKIENRPIRLDGRKIASKYSRSTYVSEPKLPQMRQKSTVGNRFSDALTRQNTFNGGVGVPHKLK